MTRDHVELNNHDIHKEVFAPYIYPSANPFVEESRATHPAWAYRGLEHYRWEKPWLNPQKNIERPFHHNVQTRILEKNAYMMKHY